MAPASLPLIYMLWIRVSRVVREGRGISLDLPAIELEPRGPRARVRTIGINAPPQEQRHDLGMIHGERERSHDRAAVKASTFVRRHDGLRVEVRALIELLANCRQVPLQCGLVERWIIGFCRLAGSVLHMLRLDGTRSTQEIDRLSIAERFHPSLLTSPSSLL